MARWWKILAVLAGGIVCFGGLLSSADAQGPLAGFFQKSPDSGKGKGPPEQDFTLTDRGEPNAFTSVMDIRPRYSTPAVGRSMRYGLDSLRPGIIFPTVTPAVAADFPNPACASNEPVSPWTMRDEGMPNAFNELEDPRPRPLMRFWHGQRRLATEMLEPLPQVVPPWFLSFSGPIVVERSTSIPFLRREAIGNRRRLTQRLVTGKML